MPVVAFIRRLVLPIVVWARRLRRALKLATIIFFVLAILLLLAGAYGVWYAAASCGGAGCAIIWSILGTVSILVAAGMLSLGWYLVTRWRAIRRARGKVGAAP